MPNDIPSAASYTTAASLTMVGGFSTNEWAAAAHIVGIIICIATFAFNVYWKMSRSK